MNIRYKEYKQRKHMPAKWVHGGIYSLETDIFPLLGPKGIMCIGIHTYESGTGGLMLFSNGTRDGFSNYEIKKYLRQIGRVSINYKFTSMLQLQTDWNNKVFESIFEAAVSLYLENIFNEPE